MHDDTTTEATTDPWANLDTQLDADPDNEWKPEPGDRIRGTLASIDYRPTKRGDVLAVLRVTEQDGTETRVPAGRKLLITRLLELKPQPGDLIGIQFDGLIDAKGGGQPYYGYRVGLVPVGDRDPATAFKDPATVTVERDLGLTTAAENATDPWVTTNTSDGTDANTDGPQF